MTTVKKRRPIAREERDGLTVVLHPALVESFREWLGSRGLMLGRIPLKQPIYVVTPTDATLAREFICPHCDKPLTRLSPQCVYASGHEISVEWLARRRHKK